MTDISKQQKEFTSESGLKTYRKMVVGDASFFKFIDFELSTFLLGNLGGIIGFGLRSLAYPILFKQCGKRPAFGKSMVLRGVNKIEIGNKVLFDDFSVLDARGKNASIYIGDFVSLGRNSGLISKNGNIKIAKGVNIGTFCRIATENSIEIGESSLVAAYSYIGPSNHRQDDRTGSFISQEMENKGGVKIGKNVWIGAHTTIMDGVSIGDNSIVGAHSFVNKDVPPNSLALGVPAQFIK